MALFFEIERKSEFEGDPDNKYDEGRCVIFNLGRGDDFLDRFDDKMNAHCDNDESNNDGGNALDFFAVVRLIYG